MYARLYFPGNKKKFNEIFIPTRLCKYKTFIFHILKVLAEFTKRMISCFETFPQIMEKLQRKLGFFKINSILIYYSCCRIQYLHTITKTKYLESMDLITPQNHFQSRILTSHWTASCAVVEWSLINLDQTEQVKPL